MREVNGATGRFWRLVALSTPGARLAALGMVLTTLAVVGPERLERVPAVCLFKRAVGRDCYACGITRAVSAAMRGSWKQAWGYNRLVAVLMPVVAIMAALDVRRLVRKKKLPLMENSAPDSSTSQ